MADGVEYGKEDKQGEAEEAEHAEAEAPEDEKSEETDAPKDADAGGVPGS
jgi:hypothetical protein